MSSLLDTTLVTVELTELRHQALRDKEAIWSKWQTWRCAPCTRERPRHQSSPVKRSPAPGKTHSVPAAALTHACAMWRACRASAWTVLRGPGMRESVMCEA